MRIAVAALFCALILTAAQSADAAWVVETVASSGNQGEYATLALDEEGTPHAAWYDSTNGRLMYAYRDFFEGWSEPEVVASGSTGKYASIAINPVTNQPAIAFMDEARGDYDEAMYAYYDGTWHVEMIDYNDDFNEGRYASLAFASDGTPFVSYHYNNGAFYTYGLNVVFRTGGVWHGDRVENRVYGFGEYGKHSAIAMDTSNRPHVIHRDSLNQIPRHAWYDGSDWQAENVVGILSDYCGEYNDIAIADDNTIWVSTFDPTTVGDNCVAVMWKESDGSWDKTEPECGSGDDFGQYTSIALDGSGNPQVSYYAAGELRLAIKESDGWEIQTLDDDGDTGRYTSLALDDADNANVLYYDATDGDVKFVWWMFPPTVESIDPDSGRNDEALQDVAVSGGGFTPDSTVRLSYPDRSVVIEGTNAQILNSAELTADFDLNGAWAGLWDVEVTNPAGTGALLDGFEIETDPPQLNSIDPAEGRNDQSAVEVDLEGVNFADSLRVWLEMSGQSDIVAHTLIVDTQQRATATFDLTDAATGRWHVALSTDYGSDMLERAFEVTCGVPRADFDAAPLTGKAPLTVQFTDTSEDFFTCEIEKWSWDFGDGATAQEQSPSHVFESPGVYSVGLTVTAPGGTDTAFKEALIQVSAGDDDDDSDDDDDNSLSNDDSGCCG